MKLDKLDKQILVVKDARKPFTEIVVGEPGTIHVRVKKMEQMGVIKYIHLCDYAKLGFGFVAYVRLFTSLVAIS